MVVFLSLNFLAVAIDISIADYQSILSTISEFGHKLWPGIRFSKLILYQCEPKS